MFSTTDTIVAIATPPGRGGIGVVRLSGPESHRIARELTNRPREFEPRHATFTTINLATTEERDDAEVSHPGSESKEAVSSVVASVRPIDDAIVTFFPAPHSYTREDVIEVSAHGSPAVLREIVAGAVRLGARVAEPGEFTLRAFLNGRLDLLQAEAVADLVDAVTPLQARTAFDQLEGTLTSRIVAIDASLFDLIARLEASVDFPDEGYQFVSEDRVASELRDIEATLSALAADAHVGRILREGARVSVVGRPNVGKSSVFNALVGVARAIVTDVPGTTRDLVTERIDLDGLEVTLVDTAGLRETIDRVEAIGVDLARQAQAVSDLILIVVDSSQPLGDDERALIASLAPERRLVVANKADLVTAGPEGPALQQPVGDDERALIASLAPERRLVVANKADLVTAGPEGPALQQQLATPLKPQFGGPVEPQVDGLVKPQFGGPVEHEFPSQPESGNPEQKTSRTLEPVEPSRICRPGPFGPGVSCVAVSALTGDGIRDLRDAIVRALDRENVRERPTITNVRHGALVERAREAVARARAAVDRADGALPEEFVLADLQDARGALEEITGRRAPDELLAHIFARFCIGK